nr:hypothetical protein CFP56_65657 [Quercus suber]
MYVLPPQLNEGFVSIIRKFRDIMPTLPKAWLSKYIQKTEALGKRKSYQSDSEHVHDLDGSDSGTIGERIAAEFFCDVAKYLHDGDLSGADRGVNKEGYEVFETVNGAAEEVVARAEVGHSGRSEGFDGGEYGFGFKFGYVGGS